MTGWKYQLWVADVRGDLHFIASFPSKPLRIEHMKKYPGTRYIQKEL